MSEDSRFVLRTEKSDSIAKVLIYTDKQTGVQYAKFPGDAGLAVLLDQDGKPLLNQPE